MSNGVRQKTIISQRIHLKDQSTMEVITYAVCDQQTVSILLPNHSIHKSQQASSNVGIRMRTANCEGFRGGKGRTGVLLKSKRQWHVEPALGRLGDYNRNPLPCAHKTHRLVQAYQCFAASLHHSRRQGPRGTPTTRLTMLTDRR